MPTEFVMADAIINLMSFGLDLFKIELTEVPDLPKYLIQLGFVAGTIIIPTLSSILTILQLPEGGQNTRYWCTEYDFVLHIMVRSPEYNENW